MGKKSYVVHVEWLKKYHERVDEEVLSNIDSKEPKITASAATNEQLLQHLFSESQNLFDSNPGSAESDFNLAEDNELQTVRRLVTLVEQLTV